MKSMKQVCLFCMLLFVGAFGFGCSTSFDFTVVEGTWQTKELRVASDDCGVYDALQASIASQVYVMGAVLEDSDEENEGFDVSETMITVAQNNIWNVCNTENSPLFNCDFPLPVIHFSQWSSSIVLPDEECEEELSLSSIQGSSNGLFLTEDTAFVDYWFEIKCGTEPTCNSYFAMDLTR